jgi:hypothetical protein
MQNDAMVSRIGVALTNLFWWNKYSVVPPMRVLWDRDVPLGTVRDEALVYAQWIVDKMYLADEPDLGELD